jgi:hypothetical protein
MVKRTVASKTNSNLEEEKGQTLGVSITSSAKSKLKAICAFKGEKMQDVLGKIIMEYIDKNKNILHE